MARDFLANPTGSGDPYQFFYETFTRFTSGFVAETTPATDAQFASNQTKSSFLVQVDFNGATSVTFQVLFFNAKAEKFFPGATYTKTPTDISEKIDTVGQPFGIIVTALTGGTSVTFYIAQQDRKLGGN